MGSLFRFQVYERVGSVISVCRGDQKEKNTTGDVEKTFSFCDLFVSTFAAVKSGAMCYSWYVKGIPFC